MQPTPTHTSAVSLERPYGRSLRPPELGSIGVSNGHKRLTRVDQRALSVREGGVFAHTLSFDARRVDTSWRFHVRS